MQYTCANTATFFYHFVHLLLLKIRMHTYEFTTFLEFTTCLGRFLRTVIGNVFRVCLCVRAHALGGAHALGWAWHQCADVQCSHQPDWELWHHGRQGSKVSWAKGHGERLYSDIKIDHLWWQICSRIFWIAIFRILILPTPVIHSAISWVGPHPKGPWESLESLEMYYIYFWIFKLK